MNEREETFDEVFDECASVEVLDFPNGPMSYARRLKAAHDRDVASKDEMNRITTQSSQARFDEVLAEKDAEIARLKSALKPVMECDLSEDDRNINCTLMRFHKAIREAQSIYKE